MFEFNPVGVLALVATAMCWSLDISEQDAEAIEEEMAQPPGAAPAR